MNIGRREKKIGRPLFSLIPFSFLGRRNGERIQQKKKKKKEGEGNHAGALERFPLLHLDTFSSSSSCGWLH
jgi:hypothetical protein